MQTFSSTHLLPSLCFRIFTPDLLLSVRTFYRHVNRMFGILSYISKAVFSFVCGMISLQQPLLLLKKNLEIPSIQSMLMIGMSSMAPNRKRLCFTLDIDCCSVLCSNGCRWCPSWIGSLALPHSNTHKDVVKWRWCNGHLGFCQQCILALLGQGRSAQCATTEHLAKALTELCASTPAPLSAGEHSMLLVQDEVSEEF